MANEIRLTHTTSGQTDLYAVIRDESTTKVWDGTGMVTWNDANITTYKVQLVDGGGDLYTADAPNNLASGTYRVCIYDAIAATVAITDPLVDSYDWVHVRA